MIEIGSETAGPDARNTVGGRPVLDTGLPWPACDCGQRMVLFFQLDVPADVEAFGDDHLLVFQCPKHNDANDPLSGEQLPPRFWDTPPEGQLRFWQVLLHRGSVVAAEPEPHLQPRPLTLSRVEEQGDSNWGFKLGGEPCWYQDAEHCVCQCGADMVVLCQVPSNFGFPKRPGRPDQPPEPDRPATFIDDEYVLFLGNRVYIAACPAHCDPGAAWPILQN
ncbi:hypothetical protein [Kutzneria chonburiensis]|uniref:DUF1963 domain-containing protein n=1 Tax=Kutzneria chonburiensis TaxID=1483604 RepID=A0ABV6MS36_9PSEU|nr:hypothetical protein [Kutzneria chonburiensis]